MYDPSDRTEVENISPTPFTTYLRQEGIWQEFTCRHTPQQIGVVERKNRHILEVVRAMMNEKNLSKSYWAKAANIVVYLMNKCATSRVHDVTPHTKYYGRKPTLSHIRMFPMKCGRSLTNVGEVHTRGLLT